MRRRALAAFALTATAALAAVSAQPATAASSVRSGVPSAAATRSRPVAPPAFRHALLAAAGHAQVTVGSPVAAAVRPIGNGVSTDLPTRVSLGADLVRVPYTVVVPTGSVRDPGVEIGLVVGTSGGTGALVLDSFTVGTAGQTTFRGALTVPSRAVVRLGNAAWVVAYGSVSGTTAKAAATGTVVKVTSLLGESVTRRGDSVRVVGATKIFAGGTSYTARPGIRVGVDRYAGNGRYVRLATVFTDRLGHLDVTVRISFRAGIRLTTADTGAVFGAVTPIRAV